jgi:hypothetical protein
MFHKDSKNTKSPLSGFVPKPSDILSLSLADRSVAKTKPPRKTRIEIASIYLKTTKPEISKTSERSLSFFKTLQEQITRKRVSRSKDLTSKLKPNPFNTNFERTRKSGYDATKRVFDRNAIPSRQSKDLQERKPETVFSNKPQKESKSPFLCRESYEFPDSQRSGSQTHATTSTNRSSDHSAKTKDVKTDEVQLKTMSSINQRAVLNNNPTNPFYKVRKQSLQTTLIHAPFPHLPKSKEDFNEYSHDNMSPVIQDQEEMVSSRSLFCTFKDIREIQPGARKQGARERHKNSEPTSVNRI